MKNCIIRAVRTFFQAFAGYMAVNVTAYFAGATQENAKSLLYAFFTASVAAGISAVMNIKKRKK